MSKCPHYDPWMLLTKAASYADLHPQTLRAAILQRELAASRPGTHGHWRIRVSEMNRWLKSMETPARKIR